MQIALNHIKDETSMDAQEQKIFFSNVLDLFVKGWESVDALIGDNNRTNVTIATK